MIDTSQWTDSLAYAVGLMVTDGHLSQDGRHIVFTSKDLQQIENFRYALRISHRVSLKASICGGEKCYYFVQLSDVRFYRWLNSIGVKQDKTYSIGAINIPDELFFHYLRGHFDGDGYSYSYYDPRWPKSFLFYINFVSASKRHLEWLCQTTQRLLGVKAKVTHDLSTYRIRYGKIASVAIANRMYSNDAQLYLARKYRKVRAAIECIQSDAVVAEWHTR